MNTELEPTEGARALSRRVRLPATSVVAQVAGLCIAMAAAFLGGAPPVAVHAGIALAVALAVLALPSPRAPSRGLLAAGGGFAVCALLAFLPLARGARPGWRAWFEDGLGLALGWLRTPQPWPALECVVLLLIVLLFGYWLLGHPVSTRAHLWLATGFVAAVGIYAWLSIATVTGGLRYPFDPIPSFGFFPNRNHTACLLAMGAIAGVGAIAQGIVEKRWIAALVAFVAEWPIAFGLLGHNDSRAGVLLLFLGVLTWVLGLAAGRYPARAIFSALVLIIIVAAVFFSASTPARNRFSGWMDQLLVLSGGEEERDERSAIEPVGPGTTGPTDAEAEAEPGQARRGELRNPLAQAVSAEARFKIYQDVAGMIQDAPLTGVGLGNFRHVFAQYRVRSRSGELCLHPESSWFLLASEAGALACAAALAGLAILLCRFIGASERPSWPLRWATAVAALAPAVHGLVDVPAHRTGVLLPALFLCGLAFRVPLYGGTTAGGRRGRWTSKTGFRLAGAAAVAGAWFLARPMLDPGPGPSCFEVGDLAKRALGFREQDRMPEAFAVVENGIARVPLDPGLRFMLGMMLAEYREGAEPAAREFERESALEPYWPGVPLHQAAVWAQVDKARALPALRDAIARAERIEKNDPRSGGRHVRDVFHRALAIAGDDPTLRAGLIDQARTHPPLLIDWLRKAPAEAFRAERERIVSDPGTLGSFSAREKSLFFSLWEQNGDRDALVSFLDAHDGFEQEGWAARMALLCREGRHEDAVKRTAERAGVSFEPGAAAVNVSVLALEDALKVFGGPLEAERLASRLLQLGKFERADQVLRDATAKRDAPAELWRLRAIVEVQRGRWPTAWACLKQHLRLERSPLVE